VLLGALNIGDSVERGFDTFFAWLPGLVGAFVILIIGYFVAKFVGNLLARVLSRAGLDGHVLFGQSGEWVRKLTSSPDYGKGQQATEQARRDLETGRRRVEAQTSDNEPATHVVSQHGS
jgi:hypothetical protein